MTDPTSSTVTKLTLEYDGAGFAGWARQPGQRTVQEELERALCVVLRRDEVPLTVAGRTDRGVHASGQVASFEGPPDSLRPAGGLASPAVPVSAHSLNALLPDDIAVLSSELAPTGFDARRDAVSRTYCYRVLTRRERGVRERGRALHWPHPCDFDLLRACAEVLAGPHDFTAFTPTETYHVRFERHVFAAEWRRNGELFEFWIEADTFMRHMNRILVGTMLQVAAGRRTLADFAALLTGRPRSEAGPTAPPHGLCLAGVRYSADELRCT